jgi:mono/diheme cytochrome c family protein
MLPGSDCVSCHSPGSGAAEDGEEDGEENELPVWTVADPAGPALVAG